MEKIRTLSPLYQVRKQRIVLVHLAIRIHIPLPEGLHQDRLREFIHDLAEGLDLVAPELLERPARARPTPDRREDLALQERIDEDIGRVGAEGGRVGERGRFGIGEAGGEGLDVVAEEELGGGV
jgi:hypothetical protein